MPTSVTEQSTGKDHQLIYPGVSSCATITCVLADGKLVGGHFTIYTTPAKAQAMLDAMLVAVGDAKLQSIYIVGILEAWTQPSAAKLAFPNARVAALRTLFTFTGKIFSYDIGKKSKDALVKLTNKGDGKAYVEWRDTPVSDADPGIRKEVLAQIDPTNAYSPWLPTRIGIADTSPIDQSELTGL